MAESQATKTCASCPKQITSGTRCNECRLKRNKALRDRATQRKKDNLCVRCGKPAVPGLTQCEEHRTGNVRAGYFAERYKDRKEAGLCIGCPNEAEPGFNTCGECREKRKEVMKGCHFRLKLKVLDRYGGKCACCGEAEPEFLAIDHINNDGAEHRREIGIKGGGTMFYQWLVKNNFPNGFQVLCFNCNFAKSQSGGCPHERRRQAAAEQATVNQDATTRPVTT